MSPFRKFWQKGMCYAALMCLIPAIGAAQTQFSSQIQSGNGTATLSNGVYYICPALLCVFPAIGAAQKQFSGAIQSGNSTATLSNTV